MENLNFDLSIVCDVVVIAILLGFAIHGLKKGFANLFLDSFGKILAIIVAILICGRVATLLENYFGLITIISDKISGSVTGFLGEEIANTPLSDANLESTLEGGNVALWLVKIILESKSNTEIPDGATVNSIVSPIFAYYIVSAISVVVLFILLRIAFKIVGHIIKKLHKLVLVGIADGLLGAVFGAIKGIVLIYVILIVIKILPFGFSQDIQLLIEQSRIAYLFTKYNLFALLFQAISSSKLQGVISSITGK